MIEERIAAMQAEVREEKRLARAHRRRAQDLMEQLVRLTEAHGIALDRVEAQEGHGHDGRGTSRTR